jgi:rhamnosyltransferase
MALIDILMGTYNGAAYIEDQVRSVQQQTHQDWRLLVRDDGSQDATLEIVRSLQAEDPRIVVLPAPEGNLGFNGNFRRLLTYATAPYVMFCDQDDVWLPHKIETTLRAMQAAEHQHGNWPILAHCDSKVVDADLTTQKERLVSTWARSAGLTSVLFTNPVQGATLMMNQALRHQVLQTPINTHFDYQAALIAEATGYRVFIDEALLLYRQHGGNALGVDMSVTAKVSEQRHGRRPSPTFMIGLEVFPRVHETLLSVQSAWLPETPRLLAGHARFLKPGLSAFKLAWLCQVRYTFYRRKDHLVALQWALGWLK